MKRIIIKLEEIWEIAKKKGVLKAFKILIGLIIFHKMVSLVYETKLNLPIKKVVWDKKEKVLIYNSKNYNSIPKKLIDSLGGKRALEYIEGIKYEDILFVVKKNNEYVYHGFVMFNSRENKIMGEENKIPLIGNCFTSPAARGHSIYTRILNEKLRYLRDKGYLKATVETHPENIASRKGIEANHFKLKREVYSFVFFDKLAFQFIKSKEGNKFKIKIV